MRNLLFFLLVGASGINFFTIGYFGVGPTKTALFLVLFSIFIYRQRNSINYLGFSILVLGYILIVISQQLIFSEFDVLKVIQGPLLQYGIPVMFILILPFRFHDKFSTFIAAWTLIALIIWVAQVTIPSFDSYLSTLPDRLKLDPYAGRRKSMVFYTYEHMEYFGVNRFAGFWHEAGAISVLMFYGIFNTILVEGTLINRRNIIFILAILASMSTSAYVALFFLFVSYVFLIGRSGVVSRFIITASLVLAGLYVYQEVEFMQNKIDQQIDDVEGKSISGTATQGRFLAFLKAMNVLKVHPVTGRGLVYSSKAEITSAEHTGYGWYADLSNMGVLLGLVTFYLFFKGLNIYVKTYNRDKRLTFIFFGIFLIVLFSQNHFHSPLFTMIVLTPFLRTTKKKYLRNGDIK